MIPILHSLAKQHISSAHNANGFMADGTEQRGFLHTDVDKLAKVHFAPCMRNLHTHLRQNAHLKHFGRLQYGLFLKAIGLPYEEALNFWRKAFHRMTDDQFTKGYLYNVRHSYGLEGKRTNYQAYNCMRIITTNAPSAGDHHGCPFKHFSLDNLKPMITDYLITGMQGAGASSTSTAVAAGVSEILNMTKQGHFQFACTRLFELTRGQALKATGKAGDVLENGAMSTGTASNNGTTTTLSDIIEHPNQYFELSFRGETDVVNSGKKIGSGGGGATGKLMMPSSSSSSSSSSSGLPILSQKSSSLSSQSQQPPSSQQDEQMIQELTQDMDFDDDLSDFDGGR